MKRKIREVVKESGDKEDSLFGKIKSQAAMEYLMTYGWAILIIALTLAVLYSLGIMNPKNFIPRAPPGSCFVFRPNGPGTTDFISLQGTCGYLPMYVASFDGVSGYVQISNSPSLNPTNEITIVGWFKPNVLNIYQRAITKWDFGTKNQYLIYFLNNGKVRFYFSNGTTIDYLESITSYATGWQHWVATFKWGEVKIYLNGILDNSKTSTVTSLAITDLPLGIGTSPTAKAYYFNGLIANVQIYNTALTPQEIQYLYQQGLGGGPVRLQNLVGWWPLNGDAKDYSGNNNHGTINGGVTFVQNYNPP